MTHEQANQGVDGRQIYYADLDLIIPGACLNRFASKN
jgi:hypothetical protein